MTTPQIDRALQQLDTDRSEAGLQSDDWAIEPMPGRVAVKLNGDEEKIGRIYIPAARGPDRPIWGTVIAICSEYEQDGEDYEPIYKVGDVVVFGKYSGTELSVGRSRVLIIRERDVLCRLHNVKQEDLILGKVRVNERD